MAKLKFKNQIYVEADRSPMPPVHKRCSAGLRWNDKQKKCLKLPHSLHMKVLHAKRVSRTANNPHVSSLHSMKWHDRASKLNGTVAKHLHAKGFTHLGNKHQSMANRHFAHAAHHEGQHLRKNPQHKNNPRHRINL